MAKRKLPEILSDQEEKALLGTFNTRYATPLRNRTMIELALSTGMRIADLLNLKWEDIQLDTGRCHIKNGKGGKDRVLFIKPKILSNMIDSSKKAGNALSGRIFTTRDGKPIYSQYCRRMIAERGKQAGIERRVYFHLCRHTYLTKLYGRTNNIRLTQEVAGHANISTTMQYTHISGADIREAMLDD